MSATFSSAAVGLSLVLVFGGGGISYQPQNSARAESTIPQPSTSSGSASEFRLVAPIKNSVNFQTVAVSSTTPGSAEEIMKTIRTADTPWSRRLLTLQAETHVSYAHLAGIVRMMQASDAERWPAPGIFHGEDGGIRFEWREGRSHTTFEVDDEGSIFVYYFDFANGVEADVEPASVDEAVTFLREHLV